MKVLLVEDDDVLRTIVQRSLQDKGHSVDIASLFPPHSGWTVLAATAINDRDEITGIGILATQYGGFALTH